MIVITGGGTGGHLSIVKSLKEELNKRGIKPVFIGSQNGQDKSWFENDTGFEEKYFFNTTGVVNKNKIGKIFSLFKIFSYSLKCFFIFKKHHIKKIISVGGYSAAAASFGAVLFKKELYIHEQNARKGALNIKLSHYAVATFSSYLSDSPVKDYPVNNRFFELARERSSLETIIFLGGSQGASFINSLAMQIAPKLLQKNISIIHQCGKAQYKQIKEYYKKNNLQVDLYDFTNDMPSLLNKADLSISRSGASTLWELCASRLPSIFIPFPYAASDHQYFNAKFLEEKELAFILRESEATSQKILTIISKIDVKKINSLLPHTIHPNGSQKIIDFILTHHS